MLLAHETGGQNSNEDDRPGDVPANRAAGRPPGDHLSHLAQAQDEEFPRTWDQEAIDSLELPRPHPDLEVRHMSEEDYYALPVRPIYRSYPGQGEG